MIMLELIQVALNGTTAIHGNGSSTADDGGTIQPDEESAAFNWSFISVLVFVVAGTLGNILVCLAVWLERPLQNVTNWFLVSLAFADLIVSTIVMPFGATAAFLGIPIATSGPHTAGPLVLPCTNNPRK